MASGLKSTAPAWRAPTPPESRNYRGFTVIEQAPFVWVYIGDPDRIAHR